MSHVSLESALYRRNSSVWPFIGFMLIQLCVLHKTAFWSHTPLANYTSSPENNSCTQNETDDSSIFTADPFTLVKNLLTSDWDRQDPATQSAATDENHEHVHLQHRQGIWTVFAVWVVAWTITWLPATANPFVRTLPCMWMIGSVFFCSAFAGLATCICIMGASSVALCTSFFICMDLLCAYARLCDAYAFPTIALRYYNKVGTVLSMLSVALLPAFSPATVLNAESLYHDMAWGLMASEIVKMTAFPVIVAMCRSDIAHQAG